MLLGVLLYAYCVGERSSRRIEKRLTDDVAFRVVAANQDPDHATLARFRRRHEEAIADLFSQVLGLCVQEGLVASGIIAIDGTKMEADASSLSNRTHRQLADEILTEAERTDATEDEAFGTRRGDELPERLAPGADRRARLREALRQLDAQEPADYEAMMARRATKEGRVGPEAQRQKAQPNQRPAQEPQDQHHRPRFAHFPERHRLPPGLQRPGRGERRTGDRGSRGDQLTQ
jgi:hypothetical protein